MNYRHVICAILLVLCVPGFVLAAEDEHFSLDDLLAIGLQNNLGLEIEKENISLETDNIAIDRAEFDPEVQAEVSYDKTSTPYESTSGISGSSDADKASGRIGASKRLISGADIGVSLRSEWVSDNDLNNSLDNRYRTGLVLELNQPLLKNLGSDINLTDLNVSRNRQRQASLNYLLEAQQYILELESAVMELAGSEQIILLRQESLELASELLEANRQRFEAGVVAVTEIQEAETAQADRELSLSQAVQEYNLQKEDLNQLLNYFIPADYIVESPIRFSEQADFLVLPEAAVIFEDALKKRLEPKINALQIESDQLQRRYRDNQLKPQLDLNLQAGVNGLAGEDRNDIPASHYEGDWNDSVMSMGEGDGYEWQVGLRFSYPLGNRAAEARYRQAERQLRKDRLRQQDTGYRIRKEIQQQRINVMRSLDQLKIAERFARLAEETLQQERRRLEEGLSDTFRMIRFQENMIEAKIGRISAIVRYHLALARMAFVRGELFERHNIVMTSNAEEYHFENM